MDTNSTAIIESHTENEKKSPSLMQHFRNQIAKIEEKFQNRSSDKAKVTSDEMAIEEGTSTVMSNKKEGSASPEPTDQAQPKKGLKFGIRVFPPNVNEKLFGKSRSKSPEVVKKDVDEVKINMDEPDSVTTTQVTIECENFNRQNSINSSGIRRDENGIPQELPAFMTNAANAARDGRKLGDSESRKSKGKAPRPPMTTVDLDASTDTMDTNLNMTDPSISNITANNTNNANMEIEDELDRITEKYLSQSKDKLNFTDNFANTSLLNKTDESVTLFDKIDDLKDDIDDVILRRKEPSNSSTPKSDRKDLNKSFGLDSSDLDLSNYGNRLELNSSDVTVHQPNEAEDGCDETRRAASLGDLSLMKKSLTEKDGNSMERAQSLDITDNNMLPKHSLALALSKPTADLTDINGDSDSDEMPPAYQPAAPKRDMSNGMDTDANRTDQIKMTNYDTDTNVPDDIKVIRYPFGSLERPKSDVLKKILGTPTMHKIDVEQEATNKSSTAPSIVFMTPVSNSESKENVPMSNGNMTSIVTIANSPKDVEMKATNDFKDAMTILSVDTSEQPISLTIVNNTTVEKSDPNEMSPIFSSNNKGINSIKISSADFKPVTVSSTIIKNSPENLFTGNF